MSTASFVPTRKVLVWVAGGSVGVRTGSTSIVGATFRTRSATDSGPDGFTGLAAYELELVELQLCSSSGTSA